MSFSIAPKASASIQNPPGAQAQAPSDARSRAIAKLMAPAQAQETPVPDPSNVAVEDLSAIAPSQVSDEQGQKDTVESASADEAEAPKAEDTKPKAEEPLSTQYAVLARKEKALRAQVQKFNSEREAFKAQQEAAKANPSKPEFDQSKYISKDRLSTDTLNALSEAGLTYEQITQLMLNPPPAQDPATKAHIQKLEAKLQALEDKQGNVQKNFEDQQTQSYNQALAQIKNEATRLVSSNADFETIKETGSVGDVVDLIERTFKEDGILMTVEEAAKEVEDHLVEEAMKITRIKKIQQRLQPAASASTPKSSGIPEKQPMKTLTNSVGASRPLTAKDRAILAFKGQLKS